MLERDEPGMVEIESETKQRKDRLKRKKTLFFINLIAHTHETNPYFAARLNKFKIP